MEDKRCMVDGSTVTEDHKEIDPRTVLQKGYVVICPEDRAKGFIRPYRDEYIHRGLRPRYPLRDLTEEEKEFWKDGSGVIKFEKYPEPVGASSNLGKFWTKEELESGCGHKTTMAREIAETYARNPIFYSSTFCVHCKAHFQLEEFVWEGTDEIVGS